MAVGIVFFVFLRMTLEERWRRSAARPARKRKRGLPWMRIALETCLCRGALAYARELAWQSEQRKSDGKRQGEHKNLHGPAAAIPVVYAVDPMSCRVDKGEKKCDFSTASKSQWYGFVEL
jgi:hypothetical protein